MLSPDSSSRCRCGVATVTSCGPDSVGSGSGTSRNRCVLASRLASVRQRISRPSIGCLTHGAAQRLPARPVVVLLRAPVPCDERRGPGRMRLYLASYQGEVLAAHTMNVVGRRVWYQTGASASHRREVRPSHALQWRMLQDAFKHGARTTTCEGSRTVSIRRPRVRPAPMEARDRRRRGRDPGGVGTYPPRRRQPDAAPRDRLLPGAVNPIRPT